MVFKAWDHQQTIQHIDFMHINGLIIIYHTQKLQLILPPAAKIHIFLYFQAAKRKICFFLSCRYSPGT